MTRRSPARFLAPLAILAVGVALFAVVTGGSPAGEQEAGPGGTPATTTTSDEQGEKRQKRRSSKTYTVKSGDTPSGIAEKTGVSVEKLLDLNPDLDPQSLVPGTKLKLR